MNVAFLSHYGLNIYLFRLPLIKELMRLGHKVFVLVPRDEHTSRLENEGLDLRFFKMNRRSLNPLGELATLLQVRRILRDLNADVLHTFMLKPNLYGAFLRHKNHIATVTGLGSLYIATSLKYRLIRVLVEALERLAFKTTRLVIFQNSKDLEYFVSRRIIPRVKARLVKGSGIDLNEYSPGSLDPARLNALAQDLRHAPSAKGKKIVLMVARAIWHKGVREFYAAASRLSKKYLFVYVGGTDAGNISSADPSTLASPHVRYMGHRDDTKYFYALCDCFVLPSYKEGLPRTLLEAGAFKKPLVATKTNGCDEVVQDGFNGKLVEVGAVDELCAAIDYILSDDERARTFGERAYAKTRDEFSLPVVIKKYAACYEELL